MSFMKPSMIISFLCAGAALLFAPTTSWSVAGLRALMVFSGVFVWSCLSLFLMARVVPPGTRLFGRGAGGGGDDRYVDLEKQSIDRTKLQELLR